MGDFTRTMPGPKTVTHTLCEPAQSKAFRHFTRAALCGNLEENFWGPEA